MKKKSLIVIYLTSICFLYLILAVSCKKDNDDTTVTDIDGNVYNILTIGSKSWMAENLRTTKFKDGSAIALVSDGGQWSAQTSAAYCWPENNTSNKPTYGRLYNGYAVKDSRGLCPAGWHVSTEPEWIALEVELGLPQTETSTTGIRAVTENVGGKLKATSRWNSPNKGANNSSGFSAIGTGYRRPAGEFPHFMEWTGYFTSTTSSAGKLWMRYIGYDTGGIEREEREVQYGYSIRCVKD